MTAAEYFDPARAAKMLSVCVCVCVGVCLYSTACVRVCKCLLPRCQQMMTTRGLGLSCVRLFAHAQTAHAATVQAPQVRLKNACGTCIKKKAQILVTQCTIALSGSIFQPDRTTFEETVGQENARQLLKTKTPCQVLHHRSAPILITAQ